MMMDLENHKSYFHGSSDVPLLFDTIGERLRIAAKRNPTQTAVVFCKEGIRKSYTELLEDSEALATGLLHLGLEKGDRLGIWAPNHYEWVVTHFASALAGLVLVNVNPMYKSKDLSYALQKVGVKALIMSAAFKRSNYYKILEEVVPELKSMPEGNGEIETKNFPNLKHVIVFDGKGKSYKGASRYNDVTRLGTKDDLQKLHEIEAIIQPDDPANIQYTSGTTGNPKGATLTHHNIVNNAYFVGRRCRYHEQRSIICIPNPLYHCFGSVLGLMCSLVHGQTMVCSSPAFEALATLEAIQQEKCTHIYGTPTMFIYLLNHPEFGKFDTSSLFGGLISGAPCPEALCARLVNDLGLKDLQPCYGTTECSPLMYCAYIDEPLEERNRTVGYLMDHLESILADDEGNVVPKGHRGEILIRGYSVMRGYWGEDEQLRRSYMINGWYRTGDIGIMHNNGSVSIVGRSKEMIVRGGENIYPAEVEHFLMQHPSIRDVQVFGVPDEKFGEVVCAWIRLHPEVEMSENDVRDYCKSQIAHCKIPTYIRFKEEHDFPLTVTGKVKKNEMKELAKKELGLEKVESHFTRVAPTA